MTPRSADTTCTIAILNHHRIAVKIPTRSFLMDIGLVGASVFVLACLMQPTETTWVAKLQRDDGTIASFRVDHPVNDENELRQAVLDDLVQSKPGKQGMVRWQNESAQFYAQADSDRLASTSRPSPFQTASFDAEKNIAAEDDSKSERWVGFWQRRSEQSATWLSQHQDAQQQRLARISQSLEIARLNSLLPARDGMLVAMAAASLVIVLGTLVCWCFPARNFSLGAGASLASSSDLNPQVSAAETDESSETASMAFRVGWVRLKQPFIVHARRAVGWGTVLSAMIGLVGRLI